MKKRIILSALLASTSSLMALGGEFAYLYKDPRIMGMGGVNVAVGGYSTSVFSNPAGLASIEKGEGFVVDILGLGISLTNDSIDFASDIANTTDVDEVATVLEKYNGQHFHDDVSNYSSVSKNSDEFAWSIGLLAATDLNVQSHTNNTAKGILATSSRGYAGVILGAAKPYHTDYGRIDVGVGLKVIAQQSYEGPLLLSDLTGNDDIASTLQDKFQEQGTGFGLDLGVTYHPFESTLWHPAFGLSVLNIGDMSFNDSYGQQPLTVNIGASITPEVSFLDKLVVGVDYVDLFNANTIRDYTYSDTDEVTYVDYTDSDFVKRIRVGVGVGLIDTSLFSTQVNLGIYQGAYTAGLDMRLSVVKLNFATYEEQIGTGSIEYPDRRYMAELGIGW